MLPACLCSAAALSLYLPADTPEDFVQGGRAMQRLWLTATACGLQLQPMAGLFFMIRLLNGSHRRIFRPTEQTRLTQWDRELRSLFDEDRRMTRAFLFRAGRAPEASARSPRLPLERVVTMDRPHGLPAFPFPF